MEYCTNCGEPLQGAKRFCASCGFRTPDAGKEPEDTDPEMDRSEVMMPPERDDGIEGDYIKDGNDFLERRAAKRAPPVEERPGHLREEEPRRERGFIPGCASCGKEGAAICIFCDKGICSDHSKKMAIMVNNMPSSRKVTACEACAAEKVGQVPTAPEAREADFLYSVKPYHEWGYGD